MNFYFIYIYIKQYKVICFFKYFITFAKKNMTMERIISIITEDGVQEEMNTLLLVKTDDDKEHLGIFCTYDNKWQSINLKAVHQEVISYIKKEKIKEIYKKIQ